MEGYIDQGKIPVAGYLNALPPGEPQFALTAAGSSYANTIQQAGGEVTVDNLGGIGMIASSGSQLGIDSLANIFLTTTSTGTILLQTTGSGDDVDITNAGTIAFDPLGQGSITGVQTINGSVYPPPGSSSASITQAGALVACLGSGAVTISSIGVGADVEIYNAGTIAFDTFGAGAISGLSTINGSAYPPSAGSISSISNGSGYVAVDSNGTVDLQATGTSFLTLNGSSAVVPNKVTLTSGSGLPEIVLSATGSNDISINNPSSTVPSFLTMAIDGTVAISGAAVNITNLSTVNNSAYPPSFVIPSDLTVSTLTAGSYVSTSVLQGISTIVGGSDLVMSATNTTIVGSNVAALLDAGGAGVNITAGEVRLQASGYGVKVEGDMNVSSISGVSTINGIVWPLTVLGDLANTYVEANGTYVNMSGSGAGYAIQIQSDNSVILGSVTANTSVVYASTIQASADGLSVFEPSGGANLLLDTGGRVKVNIGATTVTNGDGLVVGLEGATLTFPLDNTATNPVGEIVNLSTINGVAYPTAVRQATYYKSVAQNLTSGNTHITFDLSGAWNNADGYITHTDGTTDFTVVQAGLYQLEFNANTLANGATWGTGSNKTIAIDIDRTPSGEHAVISQAGLTSSANNFAQCVSATYYLEAGDVINCRLNNIFATATPTASGVTNTFDLNTFFTWRFIS